MTRVLLIILSALAMLGGVAACGSSGDDGSTAAATQAQQDEREEQAAQEREEAERKRAEAEAEAKVMAESCEDTLGDFQEAISELNSRLDIGLNYDEYTDAVADAKVEYDQIDFDDLSDNTKCLGSVGVPLEKAMNKYIQAANIWSKCFDDLECSNDQINGKLQVRWAEATLKIEKAKDALKDLAKPDTSLSTS